MKRNCVIVLFLIVFAVALIYACGGGSSGGGNLVTLVTLTNFQSASVVIGQPTFTTGNANQGGTPLANTLAALFGNPLVNNGRFYLPDTGNHRVLVFSSVPATNDASADFVLGQPNMISYGSGSGANQMNSPQTVKFYNGKFFIDEYDNSRILIWNSAPTTTQAAANIVVGQAGFGSVVTGCTSTSLNNPESIEVAGGKLIVADSGNNRVLIWNSIPTQSGVAANVVLGQETFTNCAANDQNHDGLSEDPTSQTLDYPAGLWSDGTRLIVADSDNNRVLIWDHFPTSNFAPADHVLGQKDFNLLQPNDDSGTGNPGTPTARTLNYPYFLDSNGRQLFVADNNNNRVLIWNSIPTLNFAPADRVLGQGGFTHNQYNDDNQDGYVDSPSARTLNYPSGVYVNGTKLFVADTSNNRYLIYDSQ